VIGAAIMVAKIATGEVEDTLPARQAKGGKVGGPKRAEKLTPEQRRRIAKQAADKRWNR
jgi:hypothetical protein